MGRLPRLAEEDCIASCAPLLRHHLRDPSDGASMLAAASRRLLSCRLAPAGSGGCVQTAGRQLLRARALAAGPSRSSQESEVMLDANVGAASWVLGGRQQRRSPTEAH